MWKQAATLAVVVLAGCSGLRQAERVVNDDSESAASAGPTLTVTASCEGVRFTGAGYPTDAVVRPAVRAQPQGDALVVDGAFDQLMPIESYIPSGPVDWSLTWFVPGGALGTRIGVVERTC